MDRSRPGTVAASGSAYKSAATIETCRDSRLCYHLLTSRKEYHLYRAIGSQNEDAESIVSRQT